jgi:UTP--glucose-1-phosphate uridylyltransferase
VSVTKAVIAVAGYGTRFLPATKVVPKELLSVVDKPVIQYLVEEAVAAGITDIVLVAREGTQLIADHFDSRRALEAHLAEQGKTDYLEKVRRTATMANCALVRQRSDLPYGNGSPILAAREFLGKDEPFAYMYGDDMVWSKTPCIGQLKAAFEAHGPAAVIAAQEVPQEETSRYGIAEVKEGTDPAELDSIIEKPKPGQAKGRLAQLGRFVLSSQIIEHLAAIKPGPGEELYLTDAIHSLSQTQRVLVHSIEGTWYTTGDPLRFLKTNVEYALRDPQIGADVASYLSTLDLESFR